MIDWIFGENKNWNYDRAKVPLKSSGGERKVMYPAKIRYTDNGEYEIKAGPPKQIHWRPVDSEKLKEIIKPQL